MNSACLTSINSFKKFIMKKLILILCIFYIHTPIFSQNVNITFELDPISLGNNIDPSGLYVAHHIGFGFPGDNELTDPDGDGIYSIVITKPKGFSSHYTFVNGDSWDWLGKENISGLPCADAINYNDRWLPSVQSDTTIRAYFGDCDTWIPAPDSVDITFQLNTSNITVDPSGVFIAGGNDFGNPGDNPMFDIDGDNIYSIVIRKQKGFASNYTFTNGNCIDWSCQEDLAGLACAVLPNNFRELPAIYSDTIIKTCFGTCYSTGNCQPVLPITTNTNNFELNKNLFTIYPAITQNITTITFPESLLFNEKQIFITNAIGQIVYTTIINDQADLTLTVNNFENGLYFVTVKTAENIATKRLLIKK
jgi:hypothetical protein